MLDLSLLSQISKHIGKVKFLVLILTLLPLFILSYEFYTDNLGIDPLDRLTRLTGLSALVLLILSLTVTPIRHFLIMLMVSLKANYGKRLADWNWIVKLRRTLGVMSFVYVFIHFTIYIWLDQGLDLNYAVYDIKERYFIAVGLAAFVLLIPLAATSTNKMMRLLGKKWRKLHRTVYLIAILSGLHFWMLTKVGVYDYLPYLLIIAFLLGWRIWYFLHSRKAKFVDDGMEAVDRQQVNQVVKNLSLLSEKTFGNEEGKNMAAMLFKILSSDMHFSRSIIDNKKITKEVSKQEKSILQRLKSARNSKEKTEAALRLQYNDAYNIVYLIELLNDLLQQGLKAHKENDKEKENEVWTKIFSTLMPI